MVYRHFLCGILLATGLRAQATNQATNQVWNCAGPSACTSPAAGSVNGKNTIFVLTAAPVSDSNLRVYQNGLREFLNVDYTVAIVTGKAKVIFKTAPRSGDTLQFDYDTITTGKRYK